MSRLLRSRLWTFLPFGVGLFIFAWHFSVVRHYALDIPYWDEWSQYWSWEPGHALKWILSSHNEHFIVFTKMEFWLLNWLNGGNVALMQQLNFVLYGITVFLGFFIIYRVVPETFVLIGWLLVLFFSTIAFENHRWAFQSSFHFVLLFFSLAVTCLFSRRQTWLALLTGAALGVFSIFSLAFGLAAMTGVLGVFGVFKARRASRGGAPRREWSQLAMVLSVCLPGILWWLSGHQYDANRSPLVMPWHVSYWKFFLPLLAWGSAAHRFTHAKGLVLLGLAMVPIVACITSKDEMAPGRWGVSAALVGVLAGLAAIATGRAGVVPPQSSRYAEIAMVQLPLIAASWSFFLGHRRLARNAFLALFVFGLAVGFRKHWGTLSYIEARAARLEGAQCIEHYYRVGGKAECPQLFPAPLADRLDNARRRNASFYEGLPELLSERPIRSNPAGK